MEDNILNGAEYILNAINSISNFQDFQQYKPEILKAIMDIKDTTLLSLKEKQQNYTYDQNLYIQNNLNLNESHNKNHSISNTLGLRYNYDAYLNTESVKNSFIHSINENDTPQNYEFQNMNFHNEENYQMENIPNNIITSMPLPQNYQQIPNYIDPNNNQNLMNIQNMNNCNNQDNNIIMNNQNHNIDKQFKKKQVSKVADLVMKINNDDEFYEILSKLFGEDLIDKLLSRNDEKLILGVEQAIKEIEDLRRKDLEDQNKINANSTNINNKNSLLYETGDNINLVQSNNNTIDNSQLYKNISNQKKSYADELLMKHGLLNSNTLTPIITNKSMKIPKKIKNESERKNEPYKEFRFENSLRVGMKSRKSNIIRSNSSHISNNGKKFNNYTSGYGHYFDESLQNGGESKITSLKQNNNGRRNIKGNE